MERLSNAVHKIIKYFYIVSVVAILCMILKQNLGTFLAVLCIVTIIIGLNKFDISSKKFIMCIIIFIIITRIPVILEVHNPQVSDFKTLYDISEDLRMHGSFSDESMRYLNAYNFQMPFIVVQAFFLCICNKITFLKLINVLLSLGTILLMYRIMLRISKRKDAEIGTVLYAIFANPILYNNILSNQHLFLFLSMLSFDLIGEDKIFRNKNMIKICVIGIILGIANLIRPEGILCVLTIICYWIYCFLLKKNNLKGTLLKIGVFVLTYLLVSTLPIMISRKLGIIENKAEIGTFYKIALGLNYDSNGRWSGEFFNEYLSQDKSTLRQYELEKIKCGISNPHLMDLFEKKIYIFWNSFDNAWTLDYLTNKYIENTSITVSEFNVYIEDFDMVIWFFVLICAFFAISQDCEERNLYKIYLIGAFLLYLFIEVQGRYGFIYRPFVFILASAGLIRLKSICLNKIKNYMKV